MLRLRKLFAKMYALGKEHAKVYARRKTHENSNYMVPGMKHLNTCTPELVETSFELSLRSIPGRLLP